MLLFARSIFKFLFVIASLAFILPFPRLEAQITYFKSITFPVNGFTTTQVTTQPIINYQQPAPTVDMGMHAQDVIGRINNNSPMYGSGLNLQQNQQVSQAYIMERMRNDPAYQTQTSGNGFVNRQQRQIAELNAILKEDIPPVRQRPNNDQRIVDKTGIYRNAFSEIMKMQRGQLPFSLKRMVFTVENAYLDTSMSYGHYCKQIAAKVKLAKKLMKDERILPTNSLGVNYVIQKLFSERIVEYKDTVVWKVYKPYAYDLIDFSGENDWTKMFVTKLLKTGKGQCHSMPLLYLIYTEELHAKAWLSLAPQHSFIIFSDNNLQNFYNYETTNGNPTSFNWVMESGYINSNAIKNKIYLDTLDRNALIAGCLADLIMGYTDKFGYDDFMASMVDNLLKIYPKSVQGQIFKADLIAVKLNAAAKKRRLASPQQFAKFPEVNNLYLALQDQYSFIDDLGYAHIPKEKYEAWLLSLNDEKKRAEKQRLKSVIIGNAKRN